MSSSAAEPKALDTLSDAWGLLVSVVGGLAVALRWALTRRKRAATRADNARRLTAARNRFSHAGAEMARFLALQTYGEAGYRLTERDERERAVVMLHELVEARDALWLIEGRRDPRQDPAGAEEDRRALRMQTRTQRFRLPPDMYEDPKE